MAAIRSPKFPRSRSLKLLGVHKLSPFIWHGPQIAQQAPREQMSSLSRPLPLSRFLFFSCSVFSGEFPKLRRGFVEFSGCRHPLPHRNDCKRSCMIMTGLTPPSTSTRYNLATSQLQQRPLPPPELSNSARSHLPYKLRRALPHLDHHHHHDASKTPLSLSDVPRITIAVAFTFTAFPPLPSSAAPTDVLTIPLPLTV